MAAYDVIVIGAGSAGAALAARLSEDEGRSVLLLEAGPDYRSADTPEEIKALSPGKVISSGVLMGAYGYPGLRAARSAKQEPRTYWRGRGVGGSSAINGMFAIRATVEDFDGWAGRGCTGWAFDDVLPLLNGLENDLDFGDQPYHGDRGPTPIMRTRREELAPHEQAVDAIAQRLGHEWEPDHNAPGTTGVSSYAYNSFGTTRVSTNDAYLEPARERAGLTIRGGALVDRILFDRGGAVGVRAIVDGRVTDIGGDEIVLAAGAIHSPAVLLRSGIGPAADLRHHGIDVVAELPVGRSFQDHAGLMATVALSGDVASAPVRHGQLCIRLTTGVGGEINDGFIAVVSSLGLGVPVGGLVGWVNYVESTGRIALASTDPTVDPIVEINMLDHPDDMRRMKHVFDLMRDIVRGPELDGIATVSGFGTLSPVDPSTELSVGEFADFALANAIDTQHACGSCRMGAPDDPTAVVDPGGRVLGIDGLRVADASVFPWVTRANTNLTAILVGEKIAADVRATQLT